jgi:hypothetical protein
MVMEKLPKTIGKYPRKHASLDTYWVGKDQFQSEGVSTDPEIQWKDLKQGEQRRTGKEKPGPYEVEIE